MCHPESPRFWRGEGSAFRFLLASRIKEPNSATSVLLSIRQLRPPSSALLVKYSLRSQPALGNRHRHHLFSAVLRCSPLRQAPPLCVLLPAASESHAASLLHSPKRRHPQFSLCPARSLPPAFASPARLQSCRMSLCLLPSQPSTTGNTQALAPPALRRFSP